MREESETWYSVRCVFRDNENALFEERVTLWRAESFDEAIALAETEAADYAEDLNLQYVGLAQAFHLAETTVGVGSELFTLCRESDLDPQDYIATFFDTGAERQQT